MGNVYKFFDGTPFPFDLYIWIIFTVFGVWHSCAPPKATCTNRIVHRHPTSEVVVCREQVCHCVYTMCTILKNTLVPNTPRRPKPVGGYQEIFFFLSSCISILITINGLGLNFFIYLQWNTAKKINSPYRRNYYTNKYTNTHTHTNMHYTWFLYFNKKKGMRIPMYKVLYYIDRCFRE